MIQPLTVSPKTFATVLGALGVLAGLILLFLPVHATVTNYPVACGSAAVGSRHAMQVSVLDALAVHHVVPIEQAESGCSDARSGRGIPAWILLGAGVVIVAGARFVRWQSPRTGSQA